MSDNLRLLPDGFPPSHERCHNQGNTYPFTIDNDISHTQKKNASLGIFSSICTNNVGNIKLQNNFRRQGIFYGSCWPQISI